MTQADALVRSGLFIRPDSLYANDLSEDLAARLKAQPGRYRLVASLSCPWSQRALLARTLMGAADYLPVQIAGGPRAEGYAVDGGRLWNVPGTQKRIRHLHELYTLANPAYSGRATVPVLWDAWRGTIASNESACIVRALAAVDADGAFTLAPARLRHRMDALNVRLDANLCNAVYRAGFAQRQDAYDEAVAAIFATLEYLERRLRRRRYLFGATITASDWRLFPTLARFDAVYYVHFKCTRKRLVDFPNLWAYARDLFAWRGVAATVDMAAIRAGYYFNDRDINPYGIVATAPAIDWEAPHGRERLGPARVALTNGSEAAVEPAAFSSASLCTR